MLSQGYVFKELFGKENELTEDLRFIEKIVGPIQSVYQGHFRREDFLMMTAHLDYELPEGALDDCIVEIKSLMND